MTLNPSAGPNAGLGTWPARRARITPDRTALLDPHRCLTYAELADRTARYAGALRRLGVGPGDRVAYLGVNAVEVFETFFAAWLLGAVAVPVNYRLSGPEIRYTLDGSDPRLSGGGRYHAAALLAQKLRSRAPSGMDYCHCLRSLI